MISFDDAIKIGRIVCEQVQVGRVITFGGLLTDSQRILDAAESKEGRFIGINAPRSGAYDNGFQVVHMGYGVDEKVQVPQKLYEAGVPTVLVGKVADIVSNPYGVSWQNLVDSQRIMDITLDEFNTHPTAFYLHQYPGNRPRWSCRRRRTFMPNVCRSLTVTLPGLLRRCSQMIAWS